MRLGYFAMPLHPPGSGPAQTMDDDLEQLAVLDRLGYEEAWIGGCRRASSGPTGRPSPGAPSAPAVPPTGRRGASWRPREAWERSMRLLEEQVLPRLAA